MAHWKMLHQPEDLEDLIRLSAIRPQVIFKHSTRCHTSSMVRHRLERESWPEGIDFHLIDVIADRPLSNEVAKQFDVWHESPQVLVIRNGECVFDESHLAIDFSEILQQASAGTVA